jgi:DNA-directed RNA polymerase subunit N (RpoN/RPB10)
MAIPFRCISCGKSVSIMWGAICEKCKKEKDEEE